MPRRIVEIEGRYKNQPHPVNWERSKYYNNIVFVENTNPYKGGGCAACAFRVSGMHSGCATHPCDAGAWLTKTEAAIMRLEES